MIGSAIGQILPFAIAVAISPIPIIGIVLILGSARAHANGLAFAIGWVVALCVVGGVVLVVAHGASDPTSTTATGTQWGKVAFGAVFLAMAMRQWRKRPQPGEEPELPPWMAAVESFSPVKSFGLGVTLAAINPKNLVLTIGAAAAIAEAGISRADRALAMLVFVVIASSSVVGLVAYSFIGRQKARASLDRIQAFMAAHNHAIMMVIFLVIGAKLIGDGLGGLSS